MATRKSLVIVSGLFQELNTSSDKLDFGGNTTADLTENTNLYYTNARARGSVSIASGEGLTYNSSTGVLGTSAIPNAQLANSSVTIGSTAVALGATVTTFAGIATLTATTGNITTLNIGTDAAANSLKLTTSGLTFEGATADAYETTLTATDPTADRTITLPNETGTVLTSATSIGNNNLANSSVVIGNTSVALGATVTTFTGISSLTATSVIGTTLYAGAIDAANTISISSGNIVFEGSTANTYETTLTATDATADRTITLPNATGTVALLSSISVTDSGGDGSLAYNNSTGVITYTGPSASEVRAHISVASGSGLTYSSGEIGTSSIPNAQLANSSVTVGSTGIALGGTATTIAGLASITSTAVVTDDSGFRIRDNSDNTKQLAFECSGISGSTTRTLTVQDVNGTVSLIAATETLTNKTLTSPVLNSSISGTSIKDEDNMSSDSASHLATQQSIKAYVDTKVTAEDLDVQTDSGNIDIDLDSEALILTGGTGIDTSGSGTTATFAIDATVATLVGSQTLTNKTLTSPVLNTGLSGNAFLDEDNMASDSATKVASQQSIKAYVDTKVTAEDLDITTDSGSIAIDLDSATLVLTGGTGIDTSATGSTVTYAIDSTVATLAGSQTLTNKTLTSPTINAALLTGSINLTGAVLSGASPLVFEGATANAYETTLAVTDPTADRTITLPDDSGTMATESFATAIAVALG